MTTGAVCRNKTKKMSKSQTREQKQKAEAKAKKNGEKEAQKKRCLVTSPGWPKLAWRGHGSDPRFEHFSMSRFPMFLQLALAVCHPSRSDASMYKSQKSLVTCLLSQSSALRSAWTGWKWQIMPAHHSREGSKHSNPVTPDRSPCIGVCHCGVWHTARCAQLLLLRHQHLEPSRLSSTCSSSSIFPYSTTFRTAHYYSNLSDQNKYKY